MYAKPNSSDTSAERVRESDMSELLLDLIARLAAAEKVCEMLISTH